MNRYAVLAIFALAAVGCNNGGELSKSEQDTLTDQLSKPMAAPPGKGAPTDGPQKGTQPKGGVGE